MFPYLLAFVGGLYLSYTLAVRSFPSASKGKIIIASPAIYFSMTALTGLVLDYYRLPLELMALYAPLAAILLVVNRRNRAIAPARNVSIHPFLVFAVSFAFFVFPSLPYLSPICVQGDCQNHLSVIQYIYDKGELLQGVNPAQWGDMRIYPFGFHLNAAVISLASDIPPIFIVQSFTSFLAALNVLIAYYMARDLLHGGRVALLTPLLLLFSIYPLGILVVHGSWANLMEIYILLSFILLLGDYRTGGGAAGFLTMMLLQAGLFLTYMPLFLISLFSFVGLSFLSDDRGPDKNILLRTGIYLLSTAGVAIWFLADVARKVGVSGASEPEVLINLLSYYSPIMGDAYLILGDINNIGYHIILLSSVGFFFYLNRFVKDQRRNQAMLFFFISVIVQIVISYYFVLKGYLGAYFVSKSFYVLIYPLAVFSALGADHLLKKLKFVNDLNTAKYTAIFALLLVFLLLMNLRLTPNGGFVAGGGDKRNSIDFFNDAWVYDRAGNIPALDGAAEWLRQDMNSLSGLRTPVVYYSGPYNGYWLYAMTRHKIYVELMPKNYSNYKNFQPTYSLSNGTNSSFYVQLDTVAAVLGEDDILYSDEKKGIYLYKKPVGNLSIELIKDELLFCDGNPVLHRIGPIPPPD